MDIALVLNAIVAGRDYILLAIAIISMLNGSAKGAIAGVSEVMQAGSKLNDAEALQLASNLMGKYLPFMPDFVRKWIIQMAFDSMKKKASEIASAKKKTA